MSKANVKNISDFDPKILQKYTVYREIEIQQPNNPPAKGRKRPDLPKRESNLPPRESNYPKPMSSRPISQGHVKKNNNPTQSLPNLPAIPRRIGNPVSFFDNPLDPVWEMQGKLDIPKKNLPTTLSAPPKPSSHAIAPANSNVSRQAPIPQRPAIQSKTSDRDLSLKAIKSQNTELSLKAIRNQNTPSKATSSFTRNSPISNPKPATSNSMNKSQISAPKPVPIPNKQLSNQARPVPKPKPNQAQQKTQISRKRKLEDADILDLDPIGNSKPSRMPPKPSNLSKSNAIPQNPTKKRKILQDEDLDEYEEEEGDGGDDLGLDDEAAAFFSKLRGIKSGRNPKSGSNSMNRRRVVVDDEDDDDCMEATQEEIDEEESVTEKYGELDDRTEKLFEKQRRLQRKQRKEGL